MQAVRDNNSGGGSLATITYDTIKYRLFFEFLQLKRLTSQEVDWPSLYRMENALDDLIDFLRLELAEDVIQAIPSLEKAIEEVSTGQIQKKFQEASKNQQILPDVEKAGEYKTFMIEWLACEHRFRKLMQGFARRTYPQSAKLVFKCEFQDCGQSFLSESALKEHRETMHEL